MTSPEYVDYFFSLPSEKRDQLINNQKNLYKGINFDLINSIFDLLYTKSVYSKFDVNLMTNCEVTNCKYDQGINLTFKHTEQDKEFSWSTGSLILATGYAYKAPAFLEPVWDRIRWDDKGRFDTNRNYSIDREGCELFVQNAELHTHGFVTPDLGMACYRNSVILKEITGVEHFPIEQSIAFQTFGVPTQDEMANIHPSSAHGSNNNSEIWVSQ
jgi:lysine N6-hydroxylase